MTSKHSRNILLTFVGLALLVFGCFWLTGIGTNAPTATGILSTGVLISFVLLVLLIAVGVTLWAVIMGIRKQKDSQNLHNGINRSRFVWGLIGFVAVVMSLSYLLSGGETVWQHMAGMFITTIVVLIVVALLLICMSRLTLKNTRKK